MFEYPYLRQAPPGGFPGGFPGDPEDVTADDADSVTADVTQPLPGSVTSPVTNGVTADVTNGVTGDPEAGGDTPDDIEHDGETRDRPSFKEILSAEIFGGGPGGLAAGLRDPDPLGLSEFAGYLAGHPLRPAGKGAETAYFAITGIPGFTIKIIAKGLYRAAAAMEETGKTLKRAAITMDAIPDTLIRGVTAALVIIILSVIIAQYA